MRPVYKDSQKLKDGWPSFKKETVCSVTLVLANSSLRLLKEICGKTYLFLGTCWRKMERLARQTGGSREIWKKKQRKLLQYYRVNQNIVGSC